MSGYLPAGLPIPVAENDGLSAPYWQGLREGVIRVQKCGGCGVLQWGPEWICHQCHSFDLGWTEVQGRGRIYSWERPWHPVHPALKDHGPYVVVLVELDGTPGLRMIGNLLGDPMREVTVGAAVEAVFEHHENAEPPHTLLQWKYAG